MRCARTNTHHKGQGGMHGEASDVIRVRLKVVNFVQSIVVEHSNKHVVLKEIVSFKLQRQNKPSP